MTPVERDLFDRTQQLSLELFSVRAELAELRALVELRDLPSGSPYRSAPTSQPAERPRREAPPDVPSPPGLVHYDDSPTPSDVVWFFLVPLIPVIAAVAAVALGAFS